MKDAKLFLGLLRKNIPLNRWDLCVTITHAVYFKLGWIPAYAMFSQTPQQPFTFQWNAFTIRVRNDLCVSHVNVMCILPYGTQNRVSLHRVSKRDIARINILKRCAMLEFFTWKLRTQKFIAILREHLSLCPKKTLIRNGKLQFVAHNVGHHTSVLLWWTILWRSINRNGNTYFYI